MASPLPDDLSWSRPEPIRSGPELLARLTGSLDELIDAGVARRESRRLILLRLRPEEAALGGTAAISLLVDVVCPACRHEPQAIGCSRCGGAREVREPFSACLTIPPRVTDGAILAASVELPDAIGVQRFRVVIEPARDPLRST